MTSRDDATEVTIEGSIERVTFHNPQTGFCVLKVKSGEELHTIVGQCSCVTEGENISAGGSWVMNEHYGLQLKAEQIVLAPPQSESAIEKYLASGAIKGVGVHFARRLISQFGADVIDIIENHPERLLEMEGIGRGRMQRIRNAWLSQSATRNVMIFLHEHGFGSHRASKIIKCYGIDAIARIKANPYCLTEDISGIGFKSADAMAMNMGMAADSPQRLAAASQFVLSQNMASGHTMILRDQLVSGTAELLAIDPQCVDEAVRQNIIEGKFASYQKNDQDFVCNPQLAEAENQIVSDLKRLQGGQPRWQTRVHQLDSQQVKHYSGHIELSDSQISALNHLLSHPIVILTGGPGVGKTTLINTYLAAAKSFGAYIQLCAPTGRAAKRLTEATRSEAKTIHRLLEYSPVDRCFKHNTDNPIALGGLVVDEASMLDTMLFSQLLQALPTDASLILVGDVDQLPSVGPGMILMDLIQSELCRVVRLEQVYRQAQSSLIIENAHRINRGLKPITNSTRDSDFFFISESDAPAIIDKVAYMILNRIPNRYGLDAKQDVQILTPMNRGPLGAETISNYLQEQFRPSDSYLESASHRFFLGDKVIQVVNNYDKEVFNGDIGFIEEIDHDNDTLTVSYDGKQVEYPQENFDELKLAYAITIHKSQGSEYPVVIIPLTMSHYMMLERNLVYTALTRAKKIAIFIGEKKSIMMAVNRSDSTQRITRLRHALHELV